VNHTKFDNYIVEALAKLENMEDSSCRRAFGLPCSTYKIREIYVEELFIYIEEQILTMLRNNQDPN
jgi:hypothetical protein